MRGDSLSSDTSPTTTTTRHWWVGGRGRQKATKGNQKEREVREVREVRSSRLQRQEFNIIEKERKERPEHRLLRHESSLAISLIRVRVVTHRRVHARACSGIMHNNGD